MVLGRERRWELLRKVAGMVLGGTQCRVPMGEGGTRRSQAEADAAAPGAGCGGDPLWFSECNGNRECQRCPWGWEHLYPCSCRFPVREDSPKICRSLVPGG